MNCASISCPPLAPDPYQAATLETQLERAARAFMASPEGLRGNDATLFVSKVFEWYGDDFIEQYAGLGPPGRNARERAILGVIVRHGPPAAAELARSGRPRIRFLRYDWTLNDVEP